MYPKRALHYTNPSSIKEPVAGEKQIVGNDRRYVSIRRPVKVIFHQRPQIHSAETPSSIERSIIMADRPKRRLLGENSEQYHAFLPTQEH